MTRKQIHDLLDIILDINGLEPRQREKTGSQPTAFFQFSGHVAKVRIDVFENGWYTDAMWDIKTELNTDKPCPQSEIDILRARTGAETAPKEPDPQAVTYLETMIGQYNDAMQAVKKFKKSDIREHFELVASTIKNLIDDTYGENAYVTLSDGLIVRSPDWLG